MAISTPITSGGNALWQQSTSQQAQRTATQASQAAQSLQAQARDARAVADRAQDEARSLELKAGQAQAAATQASLNIQTAASFLTMQTSSSDIYTVLPKAVSLDGQAGAQVSSSSAASVTGGLVNTTA
jgi:hypothetical protein